MRIERRRRAWVTVVLGVLLAAACFFAAFTAMRLLGELVGPLDVRAPAAPTGS